MSSGLSFPHSISEDWLLIQWSSLDRATRKGIVSKLTQTNVQYFLKNQIYFGEGIHDILHRQISIVTPGEEEEWENSTE
jgi:hypothetical protein